MEYFIQDLTKECVFNNLFFYMVVICSLNHSCDISLSGGNHSVVVARFTTTPMWTLSTRRIVVSMRLWSVIMAHTLLRSRKAWSVVLLSRDCTIMLTTEIFGRYHISAFVYIGDVYYALMRVRDVYLLAK